MTVITTRRRHSEHTLWMSTTWRHCSYVVILTLVSLLVQRAQSNTVLHYIIDEELPLDKEVGNLRQDSNISEVSTVPAPQLRFRLLGDPDRDIALKYLAINSESGVLFISRLIDREEVCPSTPQCQLTFGVAAYAGQFFHLITVYVDIEDLNDNIPTFPKEEVSISINENTQVGFKYTLPSAIDKDTDGYGVQRYNLESTYGVFDVEYDQRQVKLVVTGHLDREATDHYLLHLLAYDGGSPPNAGLLFINVTVVDRNDNHPVFNKSQINVSLWENISVPYRICVVHASDKDSGSNGLVRYSLSQTAQELLGDVFEVDSDSGEVYVIGALDYETKTKYSFEVKAYDQGSTSLSSFAMINIDVLDFNDNAPRITITSLSHDNLPIILENSNPGVFVAHVTVSDDDTGHNGDVTCDITSHFRLDTLWGSQYQILTTSTFDREEEASYDVELVCTDLGDPPMEGKTSFEIYIGDENDNRPIYSQQVYVAAVYENNAVDSVLLTISASDADVGDNGRITYSVLGPAAQFCYVDHVTGQVKASVVLDYEKVKYLEFDVQASDNGLPALSVTAFVNISIMDLNDEPPVFSSSAYTFTAPENQPGGRFVGAVTATDPDTVSPQDIRYYFNLANDLQTERTGPFRLNPISGQIETIMALDREEHAVYDVIVSSSNSDNVTLSSTVNVTIHVMDENDNAPVFTYPTADNNTLLLTDQRFEMVPVATIEAIDNDEGPNSMLSYTLLDGSTVFIIGANTGVVSLDLPTGGLGFLVFQLQIMVTDNGSPPLNATTFFYVVINGSLPQRTTGNPLGHPQGPENNTGGGDDQILTGSSLTAFICIVSIAGVLITLLLAAIVFVLLRSKKRKRQGPQNGHVPGSVAVIGNGSPEHLNNNLHNISFQSEEDATAVEEARLQRQTKFSQGQGQQEMQCVPGASPNKVLISPGANSPNYMQVQRFLEMIDSDEDSEEVSNADSGNGTSLEGETPTKKRARDSRLRSAHLPHSPPKRSVQRAVPCPVPPNYAGASTVLAPPVAASEPRAVLGLPHDSRRSDEHGTLQAHSAEGSVSSNGSDEVFTTSDTAQPPKHGILKTKILERRLNSRTKSRLTPQLSHTRVRFQPSSVGQNSVTQGPTYDVSRSPESADNVINLDNHEIEITI